ncbi:unnamed protein product [Echinostoma caproni]|uniref:HEPN domain-containing protein n=1 Tax=Echinostoma caproni TaxID=27848 RepID=A0A183BC52_9TREM|nr:unnamed protein product [Echinostoma caproni]
MTAEFSQENSEFSCPDFDANLYASKMVCANKVSEALILVNEKIKR